MTPEHEQEIRDWLAADKYTGLPGTGTVKDVCRELQTQRDECRREREKTLKRVLFLENLLAYAELSEERS